MKPPNTPPSLPPPIPPALQPAPPSGQNLTAATWKNRGLAALAGAGGALVGSVLAGLCVAPFFDMGLESRETLGRTILAMALITLFQGTAISTAILAYDNQAGLRGRWHRDLARGLPLFAVLSLWGGGLGQLIYGLLGWTRGIGWIPMGLGIGVGIGILRGDLAQAKRGALGGALGGLCSGLLIDGFLLISYNDTTFGLASQLGILLTGAAIACMMRVVQDALKSAWLMGISTGPYEGKEYPLNTQRVTVGQGAKNDIELFRETHLPEVLGAFVFRSNQWHWDGAPIAINGTFRAQAPLNPGDTIQLGATLFRYQNRSFKTAPKGAPTHIPPVSYQPPTYPAPTSLTPGTPPVTTPAAVMPAAVMPAASAPPVTTPSHTATIIWILRSESGSELRLPTTPTQLEIGRALQNQITLSDNSVSSRHARFGLEAGRLTVTDLGSTNGTLVNGQKITEHTPTVLHSGDQLQLGRLRYTIIRQ